MVGANTVLGLKGQGVLQSPFFSPVQAEVREGCSSKNMAQSRKGAGKKCPVFSFLLPHLEVPPLAKPTQEPAGSGAWLMQCGPQELVPRAQSCMDKGQGWTQGEEESKPQCTHPHF